ncbi:MAG: bacterial Ig-like domain-containing protein [Treponemataceae bacterium]|nr:bacterial Ig-like domain-containing protein [Treponemataceae bacterium]
MKKIFKAVCLAAIFLLPLVGCNDNPDTEEITIQKQIDAGGTVDLKNEVVSEDVTINKTVTLKNADFNGHTITVNANTTLIDVKNANIIIAGNSTSREAVAEKPIHLTISGNSSITSITVKANNAKIESGETVTISSLEITAEAENVAISGGTIQTLTSTASIVLTISGKTTIEKIDETIKVTVSGSDSGIKLPDNVNRITIKSATLKQGSNVKKDYEVGDSFDFTGLSVEVTYSDDSTSTIPLSKENTTLKGFSTTKEGKAIVSFTYNDFPVTGTLSININASTKNYVKLINDAIDCFADLKLDEGIEKIKQAYDSEKNDTTKMYYALSKLALTIRTDSETVKFMRDTCGFKYYPTTLNDLIKGEWMGKSIEEGDFAKTVANANKNGLNNALNKLVDILKSTYNEVVEISKDMNQASVLLPAVLIDAFGLEDFFDTSDIRVGKAELDMVIATMGITKGIFEYISAFNWTFNTSTISSDMDIDDFITAVQSGTKLLTTQNASRLADSKQSFIDATDMVISAYDYITYESDLYPSAVKDTLTRYHVFYKAATAFKDALKNGRIFYVPNADDIFKEHIWPTSDSDYSDYIVKIDCKKMFSSGVLDSAIEKDSSGKVKFYTSYGWEYEYRDDAGWHVEYSYASDNKKTLLTESFSSMHKKNMVEVKNKIPESDSYWWDCDTYLYIKVRLPDFITINDIEDNERETFCYVWDEYSNIYDYE